MGKFFRTVFVPRADNISKIEQWLEENNIRYTTKANKHPFFYKKGEIVDIWMMTFRVFDDTDYEHFCLAWIGDGVYLSVKDAFRANGLVEDV